VGAVPIETNLPIRGDRDPVAVDARVEHAIPPRLQEDARVETFLASDRRSQEAAPAAREPADFLDDVGLFPRRDLDVALGAELHAAPRVEEAEELVDLRDRADGRLATAHGRPLLDRHRGGNALEVIDVRPAQLFDELARVRRHAVEVAPLPLGEDDVVEER
jgi:hypothetical protein